MKRNQRALLGQFFFTCTVPPASKPACRRTGTGPILPNVISKPGAVETAFNYIWVICIGVNLIDSACPSLLYACPRTERTEQYTLGIGVASHPIVNCDWVIYQYFQVFDGPTCQLVPWYLLVRFSPPAQFDFSATFVLE